MKAETQAVHLEKMVQKHKLYPEYELALPLFAAKYSALKKLSEEDILLLGLSMLEFILIFKDNICARAILNESQSSQKIKITSLEKDILKQEDTKKYAYIKCLFTTLQVNKLEVDSKISIAQVDLYSVKLYVQDKYIADGTLVAVDDEIAVKIKEVKR